MLPNSSATTAINATGRPRPISPDREDKVKRYLDYCRNLQQSASCSSEDDNNVDNDRLSISSYSMMATNNHQHHNNNNIRRSALKQHLLDCVDQTQQRTSTSTGPYFIDDDSKRMNLEHGPGGGGGGLDFLLDNWLENKLQASFKQLNYILSCYQNSTGFNKNASNQQFDEQFEIFFIHHQHRPLDDYNDRKTQPVAKEMTTSKCDFGLQTKIDDNNDIGVVVDGHHHRHYRTSSMAPQSGKSDLKEQQHRSSSSTFTMERIHKQIEQLEEIITHGDHIHYVHPSITNNDNLYCLILTHPDTKLKRDSLIYCYPSVDNHKTPEVNSKIHKLSTLSGMFVTLFDVMNKLNRTSQNNVHVLNSSCLQMTNGTGFQQQNAFDDDLNDITKQFSISFIVENDPIKTKTMDKTRPPLPIILLIALPSNRFSDDDARSVAELLIHSLATRFSSLTSTLQLYLMNVHSTKRRIFDHLDRTLITLSTLLATWNNDFIGSTLCLSNTFPVSNTSGDNHHHHTKTSLVIQHLFIDELIVFNLCKYLNDFDSLDWIDESIQFYKDGNDIEQALSEHFARCLQFGWQESSNDSDPIALLNSNKTKATKQTMTASTATGNHHQSPLFIDNNHLFDLLEIELTFFSVIGSCLFYRGLFVKSHLPVLYFKSIHKILFDKGILAASKHQKYYLVYFARFYNHNNEQLENNGQQQNDLFLLIIGHGHFLHCSLLQVYRFDRSGYNQFAYKYSTANHMITSTTMSKNQTMDDHLKSRLQLPSSFAFYVFIKESFRLLNYYLDRFSLIEQLEDSFQETKNQTKQNILKLFNETFVSNQTNWFDRFNPFNMIRSSKKDKDNLDCKFTNIDSKQKTFKSSDFETYDGNRKTGNQFDDESINTHSTDDSVSFIYDSIQRFNQDYLPDSLLCFLNIENNIETFYGPILGIDLDPVHTDDQHKSTNNAEQWITSVTSEVFRQIKHIRLKLRSITKLEMKRRQKTRMMIIDGKSDCDLGTCSSSTSTKTTEIIRLMFDMNSNPISMSNLTMNEQQQQLKCFTLNLYLIGRCSIEYHCHSNEDFINDEFYACFLLDRQHLSETTFTNVGEIANTTANKNYSFGRLLFGGDNGDNEQQPQRSNDYELDQLDILMADFDDLIQNIRMENR